MKRQYKYSVERMSNTRLQESINKAADQGWEPVCMSEHSLKIGLGGGDPEEIVTVIYRKDADALETRLSREALKEKLVQLADHLSTFALPEWFKCIEPQDLDDWANDIYELFDIKKEN